MAGSRRIMMWLGGGAAATAVAVGATLWTKNQPAPEPTSSTRRGAELGRVPGGPNQNSQLEELRLVEAVQQEQQARAQNVSYATRMGSMADFEVTETRRPQQPLELRTEQRREPEKKPLPPPNEKEAGGIPDFKALIARWDGEGTDTQRVDFSKLEKAKPTAGRGEPGSSQERAAPERQAEVVAPANTTAYGEVKIGGSSDNTAAPILVEIFGGPLNGAKGFGFMSGARGNNNSDFQAVKLTNLTLADGRQAKTNAVLFSPDTMSAEVASSVDPHTFSRVVLPAAAGFAQGVGTAAMYLGSVGYAGIGGGGFAFGGFDWTRALGAGMGAAGASLGQVLRESTPRSKTINIAATSQVGILFLEPVTAEGNR